MGCLCRVGLLAGGPEEEGFRVVEDMSCFAAELDEDEFASANGGTADQAAPGGEGEAGFHARVDGGFFQEVVGGLEGGDTSGVMAEEDLLEGGHPADFGVAVGAECDAGHVAGGGVLVGGKAVGIAEEGGAGTEGVGHTVHLGGKGFFASGMIACERGGGIVAAFDHDDLEELATGVAFACAQTEFGGFDAGVFGGDGDEAVEVFAFGDDEGGEEFLGAGDLARFVGIFLIENPSASGVNADGGFGVNGGSGCGPEEAGAGWSLGDGRRGGSSRGSANLRADGAPPVTTGTEDEQRAERGGKQKKWRLANHACHTKRRRRYGVNAREWKKCNRLRCAGFRETPGLREEWAEYPLREWNECSPRRNSRSRSWKGLARQ